MKKAGSQDRLALSGGWAARDARAGGEKSIAGGWISRISVEGILFVHYLISGATLVVVFFEEVQATCGCRRDSLATAHGHSMASCAATSHLPCIEGGGRPSLMGRVADAGTLARLEKQEMAMIALRSRRVVDWGFA